MQAYNGQYPKSCKVMSVQQEQNKHISLTSQWGKKPHMTVEKLLLHGLSCLFLGNILVSALGNNLQLTHDNKTHHHVKLYHIIVAFTTQTPISCLRQGEALFHRSDWRWMPVSQGRLREIRGSSFQVSIVHN